jgi:hypothetical protein
MRGLATQGGGTKTDGGATGVQPSCPATSRPLFAIRTDKPTTLDLQPFNGTVTGARAFGPQLEGPVRLFDEFNLSRKC